MKTDIPDRMRALVLTKPGAFEVQEVPVPRAAAGEVLCKIRAVAICGSDPEIVHGGLAGYWPPGYPFIPGHEWSGEIVAVGEGVSTFSRGDRVAGQAHKGCGYCTTCMEGRYNLCENYAKPETGHRHYGFVSNGAYAQYNAYSIRAITKMPDRITYREGALVDTAGVVIHALELSGVTAGGTVAVIGPGPIGLITMRAAKLFGAATVIAVGRGTRLASAARLGADITVDFEAQDPVEAVRGLTGGLGVSEAFECSGARGTFRQAVQMVKRGGSVGLLGVPQGEVDEHIPFRYTVSNEIAIFGSKANPNVSHKILALIDSGGLVLRDLITHTFPLDRFKDALETFEGRKGGAMKVVVEPNGAESGETR